MSPPFNFSGMPGSNKKEKTYANTRARRGSIVVSHAGSKKSKKDTDSESVSSEASTVVPPPPPKPKCPLRPYMEVMFESEEPDEKKAVCPLKRVKLSHTLPLCLFIMINFCLVIGTLLVTGVCRLATTVLDWGKKQPKDIDRKAAYNIAINGPDIGAVSFLAMTALACFVTINYGPDWMRTAFQLCTTVGFFATLSMTVLGKKDSQTTITESPSTPRTLGSGDI
jgi:hypothetical protein